MISKHEPSQEAIQSYYDGMRPFWYPVARIEDIEKQMLISIELLETPLVIACLNGSWVALHDVCRHFQAQLSAGEIRQISGHGDCIMCPYHGWTYASNGQCVDIPQLDPNRDIPANAVVENYPIQEQYGLLWVCLEPEIPNELPNLPDLDNNDFLVGPLRTYPAWISSAPRVIMAALDDTHGPWVHEGLVGSRDNPEPPEHKVWRAGSSLLVDIQVLQPNNATISDNTKERDVQTVHIRTTVGIPNTIHFHITTKDSERATLIWQAVCPMRYNKTLTFWGSARNYDFDQPIWNDDFEKLQDTLREQDRLIVEGQRPWLLPPFWTKTELPLRPADIPLIEYQKWLEELNITIRL